MSGWMRLLPLLVITPLLTGCFAGKVKDGVRFDMQKVEQIQVDKSTKADVLTTLGAPSSIVRLYRGEAYVYHRTISKRSGLFLILFAFFREDTQRDGVTVVVDEKGTVKAVGSRLEAHEAAYGTPWGD